MTPQEALNVLSNTNFSVSNEAEEQKCRVYQAAFKTAIEALEKQIPKKPKNREGTTYFYCPCCDSNNINEYCGDCGQALDWSDTE